MGWKNCRGVLLSWDGKTPGESFSAGETTPEESFCPRMEQIQGSLSIPGHKASRGFILICYRLTSGESIRPGMERLQGSPSVLG